MKNFGFLSFGHYTHGDDQRPRSLGGGFPGLSAGESLRQAVELAVAAEELGAGGAYFRVHHFARQSSAPMPLLAAVAARTTTLEVGTGVIDMRYENPLYLAEEAAALDLLSGGRVALGVSRGAVDPVERGWEAFGHTGSTDPRGADLGYAHFERFLAAVRGEPMARTTGGGRVRVEPFSPGLDTRVWWGSGSRDTAEWAARQGVNLMSSTLLTEADGRPLGELQAEQIARYRAVWAGSGHTREPRVSVSRSVFPLVSDLDRALWAGDRHSTDQVGTIDGYTSTFGRSYAAEPDRLVEMLRADPAVAAADTLMLTVPSQLGVEYNTHVLEAFAEHVAPHL